MRSVSTCRPFGADQVARALAERPTCKQLADGHDPHDRGLRDVWETIIVTGRRASEVIQLRLDCVGRYGALLLLWHDQTKVGNLNAAVRIPDHLLDRLEERRPRSRRAPGTRLRRREGSGGAWAGRVR